MAIFRAGKRIGPFDIRGGISRGDFKSSAYHKTDRDPRFKMQQNTENTIGRFRAAINSAEGFARPSRFAVRIFPPTSLYRQVKLANATTNRNGQTLDNEMYNGTGQAQAFSSGVLNKLTQTIGRQVNIMCETVNMPGRDLVQQTVQYGTDVNRQMVQNHTYEGNISATFYADKYLRERQFMEFWQNIAVDPVSHTAGYYDDYVGKMHIYQLGADSEISRDMPTYAIEAMEVYPTNIGAIEYGYARANEIVKITVSFAFKYWRNMSSTTQGLSFAQHMQSPAEVKSANSGLFGFLPPELQRMGRNVFSQGRTVLNPIGRIFGGKVFPPFT